MRTAPVPFRLWAPARFRAAVSFVVAAAITPMTVLVPAAPAHAVAGEIIVEADIEDAEDGIFTFEVRRLGPTTGMGSTTVTFDSVGAANADFRAATPGVDYKEPAVKTLTFAESTRDVIKRVTFTGIVDPNDEYDERFAMRLFAANGDTITEAWGTMMDNDDPPTYKVDPVTVAESATTATVTATLSAFSDKPVSIPYRTVDDTAKAGEDYTARNGMLDFTVGQATATVDVTLTPDDRDEGASEIFKLDTTGTGTTATNATPSATTAELTADVTVTDDDAPAVLSVGDAPAVREGDTLRYPITLDKPSNLEVTAKANTTSGSATAPADYTELVDEVVTLAPGATTGTIEVPTVSDSDAETDAVTVTLSDPGNATLGTASGAGDIVDSVVAITPVETLDETEHTQHFDITLANAATSPIDIGYTVAADSAASPADFTAGSGTLTFDAGQTTKRIAVPIHADTVHENGGETFTITLTNPGGGVTGGLGANTFTILDDDSLPTLSALTTSIARPEDDGDNTATFVAGISNASNRDITLDITAVDTTDISQGGSGLGKDDYDFPSTVTILAGDTTVDIPVTVHGDDVYETEETATITATVPGGETDAASGTRDGTLTLQNDDDIPVITLASITRDEGLPTVPISATVTGTAEATIPYTVTTAAGTSEGTDGIDDFDPANLASGSIDPGETTLNLGTVDVKADTVDDDSDSFGITVTPTSVVAAKTATVTIADESTDLPPRVVGSGPLTIGEEEIDIDVPVNIDFPGVAGQTATSTDKTITVDYATGNGTAIAGTDYTATTGTLTFATPTTATIAQDITVPVVNDTAFEVDEAFTVALTSTSTVVSGTTTVTIEDEPDPKPTFSVTADHAMAETGTATFVVTLSEPASADTEFDVTVADGSATEAAGGVGSDDYDMPAGTTVTVLKDQTTASITFPVKADDVYEGDETVTVNVARDAGATNVDGIPIDRTLTITDGDAVPTITLNTSTTIEGGQASIQATPSIATEVDLTYSVALAGDASGGDNAAEAEDFTEGNVLTETIPAGSLGGAPVTLQTVDIEDDQIDEFTEAVQATVTNLSPTGPAPVTAFYKITDDPLDYTPRVQIPAAPLTAAESDGTVTVPVELVWDGLTNNDATSTDRTITVDYATVADTAVEVDDFTAANDTLTFAPLDLAESFDVTLTPDSGYELDEQFKVALSGVTGDSSILTAEKAVTITDDDQTERPAATVDDVTIAESGTAQITVNLSKPAVADVTLDVTLTPDTAAEAVAGVGSDDYDLPALTTVTIPKDSAVGTIEIPINADEVYEGDERFSVMVDPGAETNVLPGTDSAWVTIDENDPVPVLTFNDSVVADETEPGIAVTVTTDRAVEDAMNFTVGINGSSLNSDAADGVNGADDVTTAISAFQIPAGTEPGLLPVGMIVPVSDTVDEYTEQVALTFENDTVPTEPDLTAYYRIIDDPEDMTPQIVTTGVGTFGENAGNATVSVGLSWDDLPAENDAVSTEKTITVDYTTADDTAKQPGDYATEADTLTFSANPTPQDIVVPLFDDGFFEATEQFKVNLSGVVGDEGGDSLIADPETLVEITDDDSGNMPTFSVVGPVNPVGEGGTAEFTVNLTSAAVSDITFDVSLATGGVLPSAVGADYTLSDTTVTVAKDTSSTTFTVDVEDDALYEGQETATVVAKPAVSETDVQAGGELDGSEHATLTLADADEIPAITLEPVLNAVEGDDITLIAKPDGVAERPMNYSIALVGAGTDQAETTADFDATTLLAAIPGGTAAGTEVDFGPIPTEIDKADENVETIKATATNTTYPAADPVEQTFDIGDDPLDMTPKITTAGSVPVGEEDGDATIPVTLSWAGLPIDNDATSTEKDITVKYATADDTAKQPGDYTTTPGTLTFPANDLTPQDIVVPLTDDGFFEATEQFKVNLSEASGDTVIADPATSVVITDDDSGNMPGYSVTGPANPVGEGGSAEFTVTMEAAAVSPITFDVSLAAGGVVPSAVDADHDLPSATVTVPQDSTSATFTVDILDDALYEGEESATVVVKPASGETDVQAGTELDGSEHTALTLADADQIPAITFEPVLDAVEGDTLTVVAKPNGVAERDMVYTVTIDGAGTVPATATDDFTATPVPVTIQGGTAAGTAVDLLEVQLVGDDADEYTETILVTATNDTHPAVGLAEQSYDIADDEFDMTPRLVAGGPQTVGESTPAVDVPVSLSWAGLNGNTATSTQKTITVKWATEDGTAVNPGDYVTAWNTMTFEPGQPLSQNATVTIADTDTVYEADETFKVKLSEPSVDSTIAVAETVVTIDDDDEANKPGYTVTATSLAEGETAQLTVELDTPAVADITFDVTHDDDTATEPDTASTGDDDYDLAAPTVTVLKNATTATVDIPLNTDAVYEGAETATLIAIPADLTHVKPGTETDGGEHATLTIADANQIPAITLNTVTDGAEGGTIAVTATPDGVAERDVTYSLTLAGAGTDPADAGDFTDSAATATIPAGTPAGDPITFRSIPVASDLIDENTETIEVTAAPTADPTKTVSSTYAIVDAADNKSPNIVATTPAAVNENAGTALVPVALDFTGIPGNVATSTERTISVDFATVEGTAKAVTDYSALDDTLTFSPWNTPKVITVPLVGDDAYELTEQFTVHLDNPTVGSTVTTADTVVEVTDTDTKPTFTITPSRTVTEGETASYTVTLGSPAADDVTLDVAVVNGTTTDGGTDPGKDDYTAPANPVTILKGQSTATVNVPVADDTAYEGQESATVRVTLGANETEAIGGPADGTLTITDGDAVPTIALTAVEGAEGAPVPVVARPSGVAERDLEYTVTGAGDATAANNAAEPADWTNTLTTGTVPAGTAANTPLDFGSIPLLADTADEALETIKVTAHNTTVTTPDVSAFYRITDDPLDKPPSVALGSLSVNESAGAAEVPVALSFGGDNEATSSERPVSVTYQVLAGTTSGLDRGSPTSANPLVIAAGATSGVIRVPITDDAEDEVDETFRVKATAVSPAEAVITTDTGSVVITDNDDAVTPPNPGTGTPGTGTPGATPSISVADVTVAESATSATFTVALSAAAPGDVDLTVGMTDGTAGDATAGPGGDDYDAPATSLVIAKGARTGTVTVPLRPDQVYEGEEKAQLTVAPAAGETDATGSRQAILTITDDDARPTVTVAADTVTEGENITISAVVTGLAQREFTIAAPTVTPGGGGSDPIEENEFDFSGDDAVVAGGSPSGSTVELGTIQFSDDTMDEHTETLSVNLAQGGTATRGLNTVVFRVDDDPDDVAPTVSITDAETPESAASVDLEVSLEFSGDTTGTERTVTVPWRTIAGSAKAGEDFTMSSGTVTLNPPAGAATVSVPMLSDGQKETDQTFSVYLSGATPSDVTIARPKGIVTIDDDDKAKAPTLSAPGTVTGGGRVTISGTASPGSAVQLLSAPGTSGGEFKVVLTATADKDGKFSFSPNFTGGYRLMVKADNMTSPVRTVQVRQEPTIALASNARGAVTVTVTGDPARGGQDVRVQQLVARKWQTVATGELNRSGKFTTTERGVRSGNQSFRAVIAATPSLGILGGTSPAKQVRVR
ncbi:Calx-beta domain-containing protein [Actinoplanes xinjiangensis]|uniref:Calx-beta domain-containing protein n=1 Tax=Actinoplanes xinjiangensis TaxID=512350 RepID=UPI003447634B